MNLFVILTDHNKIPSPPCYHLFLTCHSIKTDLYLTNPLHPYINVQVLQAILYTFPMVLKRKICLTIKFRIIAFILMTLIFDSGVTLLGEIRCLSLLGSKGLCDKQMLAEMMLDDKQMFNHPIQAENVILTCNIKNPKPNHEPACSRRSYTRPKTVSNWLLLNLLIITVHNSTF